MSMLLIIAARTTPRIGIAQKVSRWEEFLFPTRRMKESSALSGEVAGSLVAELRIEMPPQVETFKRGAALSGSRRELIANVP